MRAELGFVLRTAGSDSSCGGCTSKYEILFVFPENATNEEIEDFVVSREKSNEGGKSDVTREKCVRICLGINRCNYAEVVFKRPQVEGTYMASGNFICSSNASFINMIGHSYPISVHDRFESWAGYEALST